MCITYMDVVRHAYTSGTCIYHQTYASVIYGASMHLYVCITYMNVGTYTHQVHVFIIKRMHCVCTKYVYESEVNAPWL
jgi:hypothetical protein